MSEDAEMDCVAFADVAAELALGVLTGRERAQALAHLEDCAACREHVGQLTTAGEELLALLPSAEPPPGFETRVLERLGLTERLPYGVSQHDPQDPSPERSALHHPLRPAPAPRGTPRHRIPPAHRAPAPRGVPAGHGAPAPNRGSRAPLSRRFLAAAAVVLAVVAAGLGGWGLRVATAPHPATTLTQAALLSTTREPAGQVFLYQGNPRWMYMTVELDNGSAASSNGMVACQLKGASGRYTTIGWFKLASGYGAWGGMATTPDGGTPTGIRLITSTGTVVASAAFPASAN